MKSTEEIDAALDRVMSESGQRLLPWQRVVFHQMFREGEAAAAEFDRCAEQISEMVAKTGDDVEQLRRSTAPVACDEEYWAEIGPVDDGVDEALDEAVVWFGRVLVAAMFVASAGAFGVVLVGIRVYERLRAGARS